MLLTHLHRCRRQRRSSVSCPPSAPSALNGPATWRPCTAGCASMTRLLAQVLEMKALTCRLSTLQCSRRAERACHLEALYCLHAARLRLVDAGPAQDLDLAAQHTFSETASEGLAGQCPGVLLWYMCPQYLACGNAQWHCRCTVTEQADAGPRLQRQAHRMRSPYCGRMHRVRCAGACTGTPGATRCTHPGALQLANWILCWAALMLLQLCSCCLHRRCCRSDFVSVMKLMEGPAEAGRP